MAFELRHRSVAPPQPGARHVRTILRVGMLAAIVLLASLQGYSVRSWVLVGGAVLWAASLPFVLRGLARRLRTYEGLADWQRTALLVVCALILLGGFAVGARLLLV